MLADALITALLATALPFARLFGRLYRRRRGWGFALLALALPLYSLAGWTLVLVGCGEPAPEGPAPEGLPTRRQGGGAIALGPGLPTSPHPGAAQARL